MRRSALLFVLMLAGGRDNPRARVAQFPADSGVVNVRDFGAKGDGQHDDTAALTAAIAAAGEDTGAFFWRTRIVVLPAGTYRVSASADEALRQREVRLRHDPDRRNPRPTPPSGWPTMHPALAMRPRRGASS